MHSKPHKSPAWANFEKVKDSLVRCGICGTELSYRGSTSTMLPHLKKHPSAATATERDGPDSNYQTNMSTFQLLKSVTKVIVKDMLNMVYDG